MQQCPLFSSSVPVNRLRNKIGRFVEENHSSGKMRLWLLSDVEMLTGKGAALWLHLGRCRARGGYIPFLKKSNFLFQPCVLRFFISEFLWYMEILQDKRELACWWTMHMSHFLPSALPGQHGVQLVITIHCVQKKTSRKNNYLKNSLFPQVNALCFRYDVAVHLNVKLDWTFMNSFISS